MGVAIAAWLGFTLPSAVLLCAFGYGILSYAETIPSGLLHGLKVAAVAIVAQAVWAMGRTLCPDAPRVSFAAVSAIAVLAAPSPLLHVSVIAAGGIAGWLFLPVAARQPAGELGIRLPKSVSFAMLSLFLAFLLGLPLVAASYPAQ